MRDGQAARVFGRTAVVDELAEVVDAAVTGGRGQLLSVEGEAGIGKTTVAAVLARALGDRVPVLWASGRPEGGMPPYWAWSQLLVGHLALVGSEASAAVRAVRPALGGRRSGGRQGDDPGEPGSG